MGIVLNSLVHTITMLDKFAVVKDTTTTATAVTIMKIVGIVLAASSYSLHLRFDCRDQSHLLN